MNWLTIASLTKLLFLLLPIFIRASSFSHANLEEKSAEELEEYRRHLSEELTRVSLKVEANEERENATKRGKRTLLSPLSASLPNRESAAILDRMEILKEEKRAREEEKETDMKEERVDQKLIALLNSFDDFENVTEEASGEMEPDSEMTLTTTEVVLSSTTSVPDASTVPTTDAPPLQSTLSAPSVTPLPMHRSQARGVPTVVASPHSPSLSPMLVNFTLMEDPPTSTGLPLMEEREERRTEAGTRRVSFNPTVNHTAEECRHLTQHELVRELKQKGTYNPDLMAWDVFGILRFLDRTIAEQYEMQMRNRTRGMEAAERNMEALSRILGELDVSCDVKTESVRARMQNLTMVEPRRSILSPHIRRRSKREAVLEELTRLMADLDEHQMTSTTTEKPSTTTPIYETVGNRQKLIGESHVVPFGCDRRGTEEDGYLRLCSACQSIRRLPDSFFPPFINEVTCDEDNACLYFYDYPHGRCKQKHMNFVVLRNIGTQECQVWRKFNLNVRVSCECFVDEMSFFAKYV